MDHFQCDGGCMDVRPLAQHTPEKGILAMAACLSDPVVRRGESDPFDLIELAPVAVANHGELPDGPTVYLTLPGASDHTAGS